MGLEFDFVSAVRGTVLMAANQRGRTSTCPTPGIPIGDDCGAWSGDSTVEQLVSTDLLLEGTHFLAEACDPNQPRRLARLGDKAMAVNLSDIAAMGGTPRYATLGLGLPARPDRYLPLVEGFVGCGARHGVTVLGGDTTRSNNGLTLAVTVIGEVAAGHAITRAGASAGDRLYVSGTLGDSRAGLAILTGQTPSNEQAEWLTGRHHRPRPQVALGQAVGQQGLASAMIDLSDGLLADLGHLLAASGVSATLEVERLPLSAPLVQWCDSRGEDPLQWAVAGGEDYELLLAVPPDRWAQIEALSDGGKPAFTRIGQLEAASDGAAVRLTHKGTRWRPALTSYEHHWV